MNILKQIRAWLKLNWAYFRFLSVVFIVVVFGIWFFSLKNAKQEAVELSAEVAKREAENALVTKRNLMLQEAVDSIKNENTQLHEDLIISDDARERNAEEIDRVAEERDALKDSIENMGSNELFTKLNDLYKFPGERKYKINIRQVEEIVYITLDYTLVKEENKILKEDIAEADNQISIGETLRKNNERIIAGLEEKDLNSGDIISNLEEINELSEDEIKRLERKLFWRTAGAVVVTVAAVILAL